MKVTLNIDNDKELRAYIKEQIKNQVLNIAREEFKEILKTELERKMKGLDKAYFERLIKDCMKEVIRDILYKEHNVSNWSVDFVRPSVNERLNEVLDKVDWKKMVDTLAKEKLRSLVQ